MTELQEKAYEKLERRMLSVRSRQQALHLQPDLEMYNRIGEEQTQIFKEMQRLVKECRLG